MTVRALLTSTLLLLAVSVHGAQAAQISHFSPQGEVAKVESIKATFSESVIAFGDGQAPAPFEVSCDAKEISGQGRWVDARNWTYVFTSTLPAGVSCTATTARGFRSLDGQSLTGKQVFSFSTGGPQLTAWRPYGDTIDEDQIFVLQFNGAVDTHSLLEHGHCVVQGLGEAVPLRLISNEEQRKAILEASYIEDGSASTQLVQCKRLLPADARVEVVLEPGIKTISGLASKKARSLDYKVRKPFKITSSCQRENARSACLPVLPLYVQFSAPVSAQQAAAVYLQSAGKTIKPDPVPQGEASDSVQSLVFSGPFEPESEVTVVLPADIRDDAGRALSNADEFPLQISMAAYPSLVKFASGTFGIIERFAHVAPGQREQDHPPTVALTVRNVESNLLARDLSTSLGTVRDHVAQEDAEVLRWYAALQKLASGSLTAAQIAQILRTAVPASSADKELDVRGQSVLKNHKDVRTLTLPAALQEDERPLEVIGVPLAEPGFHVLEVESARLGNALLESRGAMFVRSGVLVSNLGVHLKQGRDDLLVWVTSLDEGQVVEGAQINVLDCSGQLLASGRSDASGLWHHDGPLPASQYCEDTGLSGLYASARIAADHPLARGKPDFSFVLSQWDRGMEPWRFNVPVDERPEPTVVTHTVFDRTLLRAGETVSMKHFARIQTRDGLALPSEEQLPDRLVITHAGSGQRQELALDWQKTPSGGLSAQTKYALTRFAKLGEYEVTLLQGDDYAPASGSFRVEEFKLPVLEGSLKISDVQGDATLLAPTALNADIQVAYVSGGAAARLPVSLSAVLQPKYLQFDEYGDYSFNPPEPEDEQADSSSQFTQQLFLDKQALALDEHGVARVRIDTVPAIVRPVDLRFEASFADPNGQVQTLSQTVSAWPAAVQAGIRSESWIQQGKPTVISALALSPQGLPQVKAPTQIRAVLRTTYSTRQRMVGGFYSYSHHTSTEDLGEVCSGTTDENGVLRCEQAFDQSGSIQLIARVADDKGRYSEAASSVWVVGGKELWFEAGNDDRIDIIPSKKAYAAGEEAEFQVRMPFRQATALVSVEREGVLDTQIVQLEGKDPRVRIPVLDSWGPNVYVSVLVLRGRLHEVPWYSLLTWGWKQPGAWLDAYRAGQQYQAPTALIDLAKPAFRFGLTEIRVHDERDSLKVSLTADKERYQVRDKVQVDIQVSLPDGQPAAHGQVAFAAVDEALLELAPNDSWNLLESMRQRRSYGVQTATGQTQVVGRRHYGRKALAAGGGGGKNPTRELLDTLLLWAPDVQLDANGRASIVVPLNDSISAFRLVAVADLGAQRFGKGQATIISTQDVQLISGLPAVLREGDRYQASVTVRNTTTRDMSLQLTAQYQGQGVPDGKLAPKTLALAAGQAQTLYWDVAAPQAEQPDTHGGVLAWTFTAQEQGGEAAGDSLAVQQAIVPLVPLTVHQASLLAVDENNPQHLQVSAPKAALKLSDGRPRGGLEVFLRSSLGGELPGVQQWLRYYPYTCLEQLGSRAMGMHSVSQWRDLMHKLPDYLDENGLASYFPGASYGSEVLTAYLLAISHEAKNLGMDFALPADELKAMQQGLLAFVQGRIERQGWAPSHDLALRKLLVLEALSRYHLVRPAMLDSIQIAPDRWPTGSVVDWLAILQRVPDIPRRAQRLQQAQQILQARMLLRGEELIFAEQDTSQWWLMRSAQVDLARLILTVSGQPGWDVPRLAQGLMSGQHNGAWRTTTENLLGSLAMQKFSQTYEQVPLTGQIHVALQGEQAQTLRWGDAGSASAPARQEDDAFIAPADVQVHRVFEGWPLGGSAVLDVRQEGFGTAWVSLRSKAAVPVLGPVSAGFEITRSMTPVSQAQSDRWVPGDVYRVRLSIRSRAPATWAVISDPIPAGASVLGSGLGRDSAILARDESQDRRGPAPSYVERGFAGYRAYYEYLPQGVTHIEYTVRLNTVGHFQLPPTRIEALYQPDVYGVLPHDDQGFIVQTP